MNNLLFSAVLACTLTGISAQAAPTLSLVSNATSASNATITVGTTSFALDLRFDTGGMAVDGLQFFVSTSPAATVQYGTTPVTALDNPFTASDLSGPDAGAVVQKTSGETAFFKSSSGDYAAFSTRAIATLNLNTMLLANGVYVFTPVAEEFVNSSGIDLPGSSFATPGTFRLTVTNAPEPDSFILTGLGCSCVLRRRRLVASGRRL